MITVAILINEYQDANAAEERANWEAERIKQEEERENNAKGEPTNGV